MCASKTDSVDVVDPSMVQVLPPGELAGGKDKRLVETRHLGVPYSIPRYETREDWLARAEELRTRILVSAGLWPFPRRCPLNAQVFERIEREGYSVEKVYFESYPGFFVTGNLYRPSGRRGPFPAVLNPHGHWGKGRLEDSENASIPGRCIGFARQGYVAFSYDMVGFGDSTQVRHGFGGVPESLWGISVTGLQLWNSMRCLDFVSSLADVDPERIGCTGESGGGTQTFLLGAVDERIKVACPVNMVSAHMQGGCLCENAPLLRTDCTNVEFAALMAPRPMLMISCTGDWTSNTREIEYPAVRSIYQLFGAEEKVGSFHLEAGHNYNRASREAAYAWFSKWLRKEEKRIVEEPFEVEPAEDLKVFARRPRPESALDSNGLVEVMIQHARDSLVHGLGEGVEALDRFRQVMFPALRLSLSVEVPAGPDLVVEARSSETLEGFVIERLTIGRTGKGDCVPAVLLTPRSHIASICDVVISDRGKTMMVDPENRRLTPLIQGLTGLGHRVLSIDPFLTGEFHAPWAHPGRQSARFFTTYNKTDTALRIQDIVTALVYAGHLPDVGQVNLVGQGDAGLWCALARALTTGVARLVADMNRFDRESDDDFLDRLYVPGIRRAGDIETALVVSAPASAMIHNLLSAEQFQSVTKVYASQGCSEKLVLDERPADTAGILNYLTPMM